MNTKLGRKRTCTSHALKKGYGTQNYVLTPTPSFFQIKEWHLFKKGWGSMVQSSHCLSLYECLVFQFTQWPTVHSTINTKKVQVCGIGKTGLKKLKINKLGQKSNLLEQKAIPTWFNLVTPSKLNLVEMS